MMRACRAIVGYDPSGIGGGADEDCGGGGHREGTADGRTRAMIWVSEGVGVDSIGGGGGGTDDGPASGAGRTGGVGSGSAMLSVVGSVEDVIRSKRILVNTE